MIVDPHGQEDSPWDLVEGLRVQLGERAVRIGVLDNPLRRKRGLPELPPFAVDLLPEALNFLL